MASRDLTHGAVPRHLIALSLPVAGAMLLQSAYALIDLAFVRMLGEEAVAGLSISFQAFFIVLALSQAVATTALAEMSHAYGAGEVGRARRLFSTFSLVGVAVGSVSAVLAWRYAEVYVDTFTNDPAAYDLGVEYFRVTALSFLLQLLLIVFGSGMRASGDFATPMRIMATSVLLNLALDPLLIFGAGPVPALGLAGAAWSTVASQGLGAASYVWLFVRRRRIAASGDRSNDGRGRELYWMPPCWSRTLGRRLVTRGLPAGFQFFLLSAVVGGILAAMKPFGAQWTATAGGGFRVLQQTLLPVVALGSAAAAIVGQNLGAQEFERMRRAAWTALRWGTLYGLVVSALLGGFGRIAGLVFAKTPADLDLAQLYFWWSAPTIAAFAFTYVPTVVLQATGRALPPMLSAAGRVAVLWGFIFLVFPASGLSPDWVFGAATATALVEGAVSTSLMSRYLRRCDRTP